MNLRASPPLATFYIITIITLASSLLVVVAVGAPTAAAAKSVSSKNLDISSSASKSQPRNEGERFPLTGTIDQIGSDIRRIKGMGVDHIIFGYNFVPIGRDVIEMIDTSKQLSKFAR